MRQPEGREVVIVEAVRTPIGRGHKEKGYYKDTHPNTLLGKVLHRGDRRAPASTPREVEDVIAGCVQQFGEQGFNIARNAWLQEGLPIETPGTTVDRQCGSAQQAVNFSAALIAAGVHDAMIGSGVEHMGHLPFAAGMKTQEEFGFAFTPELMAKHNIVGQGLGAEMIADQWEIPRSELDELARALAQARPPGHRGGPLRARDRADDGQRRHVRHRPGHPSRHEPRGALAAEARVQARRQDHRRQRLADLRRRGRRAADVGREGQGARAERRARGSSTRRPSAATR